MLLSEATQAFLTARAGIVAPSTLTFYAGRLGALTHFLADPPIETITLDQLRKWRATLSTQNLSPFTVHGYLRATRTLFNWMETEQITPTNPATRLKLPPLPHEPKKDIAQADARAIIHAAQDQPRDYAILRLLADTGARVGGLATLTLERLQLQPDERGRYRATVLEKGRGGERKARTCYFGPATAEAITAYLAQRPPADTNRLFLTLTSPPRPLRREGIYRMIQRYAERLGIEGRWNPHSWRHAFAHGLIDAGIPLSDVSQLLGHSSITVTVDFYGQRADEQLADAHARGSWINGRSEA
jgi:integrase/recombinase XerD